MWNTGARVARRSEFKAPGIRGGTGPGLHQVASPESCSAYIRFWRCLKIACLEMVQVIFPLEFLEKHGRSFPAWQLDDSRRYTCALTRAHYENFSVASLLVPKRLRQDHCNVYAYCRWADDLGDETGDPAKSLDLLGWWRNELRSMYSGQASHPVFVALKDTVAKHGLPQQDFEDLLHAFEQDQSIRRYGTYAALLEYCRYSANPVGRLVLRLNGCVDEGLFGLSDRICTALQMANHWQDIRRDWSMDRVYMPIEVMESNGYSLEMLAEDMASGTASAACKCTVRELAERAACLFASGLPLADRLDGRLALEIELFARAGLAVLEKIRGQDWDTIAHRPTIHKSERMVLLLRVMGRRLMRAGTVNRGSQRALD